MLDSLNRFLLHGHLNSDREQSHADVIAPEQEEKEDREIRKGKKIQLPFALEFLQ